MSAGPSSGARRVVVTGMGAVTPLGNDVTATWDGLVAGRSGIRTIAAFDPSRLTSRMAGEVIDLDASRVLDRKDIRRVDRYIQLGLVATREAMDQAGLPARLEGTLAEETGVILGTGLGGVGTLVEGIAISVERGPDRISPFFVPYGIPNVGAGMIAIAFGPLGPNFTTFTDTDGLTPGQSRAYRVRATLASGGSTTSNQATAASAPAGVAALTMRHRCHEPVRGLSQPCHRRPGLPADPPGAGLRLSL